MKEKREESARGEVENGHIRQPRLPRLRDNHDPDASPLYESSLLNFRAKSSASHC